MQTKLIQIGKEYKIRYRIKPTSPLQDGYGVCEKLNWGTISKPHIFVLSDGTKVQVTSQGVLRIYSLVDTAANKLQHEINSELDSDTINELQEKLAVVKIMLEGLGIKSTIDGTKLSLPYKDAIALKIIAAKLLQSQGDL